MTDKLIKDNFDINVFDRGQYNEPGSDNHEWVLCPYSLATDGGDIVQHEELFQFNLEITEEEAKQLTLGWGTDLGGDYAEDEDFWIDSASFKTIYKDIPERVALWLDFVEDKL